MLPPSFDRASKPERSCCTGVTKHASIRVVHVGIDHDGMMVLSWLRCCDLENVQLADRRDSPPARLLCRVKVSAERRLTRVGINTRVESMDGLGGANKVDRIDCAVAGAFEAVQYSLRVASEALAVHHAF